MAHFTKEEYEYKREYAENRFDENAQIAQEKGMTDEQVDAIAIICRIRHDIHSGDRMSMFFNTSDSLEKAEDIEELIAETELPSIEWAHNYIIDCVSIIDYDELMAADEKEKWEAKAEKMGYQTGVDCWMNQTDVYDDFYEMVEDFNSDIEKWLKIIDNQYGTSFCPTGIARRKLI